MSISLRSNADGSGTLLNGSTPVMEITAAGVVSLPNIAAGSSANQPVNFGQILGVGQTWQDVTASRVAGVTYTNTTGKPIIVNIIATASSVNFAQIIIDGIDLGLDSFVGSLGSSSIRHIIPAGSTYIGSVGSGTVNKWYELR